MRTVSPFQRRWGLAWQSGAPSGLPHSPPRLHAAVSLSGPLLFLTLFASPHPGLLRSHSLALLTSFMPLSQCFEITSTPACLIYPRCSRAGACLLVPHPGAQCLAHGPKSKERKVRGTEQETVFQSPRSCVLETFVLHSLGCL